MHFARSFAALAVLALAGGCTCGALDPSARFACSTTAECGPGYVCAQGECVSDALNLDGGRDAGGGVDGGGDAGLDAGVDADRDGYPVGIDCDDANPFVNPSATESCVNQLDDDCDQAIDCAQASCNGLGCVGGGTCTGLTCMAATEVLCDDASDNDGDQLVDCADPDCPVGARCEDRNVCSAASACNGDGGCVQTQAAVCMTPPSVCYAMSGSCSPDAGCSYAPRAGPCEDGLVCTVNDACNNGACLGGPRMNCPNSPNACLGMGSCVEDAGCVYQPRGTNVSCSDGNACTTTDRCDGDGGCLGQPITCTPPSQCHASAGCVADAGCQFTVLAGAACDAGALPATCSATGVCTPTSLFGYPPSNFTETQLPVSAPNALNLTCDVTLNTSSNSPTLTGPCIASQPAITIITSPLAGVPEYVLIETGTFTLAAPSTLTLSGTRPAIFAVLGSATIGGRVRALNATGTSFCSVGVGENGQSLGDGSGGAGHATLGANGAGGSNPPLGGRIYGVPTLVPLLSGCRGGGGNTGGPGGGAVQFSVRDDLVISGSIAAPGLGGQSSLIFDPAGGGGSGGSILLEARTISLLAGGWLTANGGGGAEGSPITGLGGANGADGNETSALPAQGGNGGTSGGNGGAGGAGVTLPTVGQQGSGSAGDGAGGGAVGRIRLNATMSCAMSGGISPPASSNGAPGCP